MIIREFNIENLDLRYFVGINQINFNLVWFLDYYNVKNGIDAVERFFKVIEEIQTKYKDSVIQFFKDNYILNSDHIFMACFNLQKAFQQNINISKKKNIELLLYLATNRQIIKSMEAFGIDYYDLEKESCTYCIISPMDNLRNINDNLLKTLNSTENLLNLNNQSPEKFNKIRKFFNVSEDQLKIVINAYGIDIKDSKFDLCTKYIVLNDIICEKMALMSLSKVKVN